jgi:hypothetical protein
MPLHGTIGKMKMAFTAVVPRIAVLQADATSAWLGANSGFVPKGLLW